MCLLCNDPVWSSAVGPGRHWAGELPGDSHCRSLEAAGASHASPPSGSLAGTSSRLPATGAPSADRLCLNTPASPTEKHRPAVSPPQVPPSADRLCLNTPASTTEKHRPSVSALLYYIHYTTASIVPSTPIIAQCVLLDTNILTMSSRVQ